MEKYISYRVESFTSDIYGAIYHDTRIKKPSYLKNNNANVMLINGKMQYFNSKNNKQLQKELSAKYKNLRSLHIEEYEEAIGQKFQDKSQSIINSILTFSSTMTKDYEENYQEFYEALKEALEALEKDLNTSIFYSIVHLDETTPHAHIYLQNWDKDTKRAIKSRLTKQKLSELQTLFGEIFDRKMGYKRGKSKEETQATHQNIKKSHKIAELKAEIIEDEKKLLEKKEKLKALQAPKQSYSGMKM